MLAELAHHVIGVDPDRDWITLAVVDAHSSGVVAEGRFPATGDGYRDAVELVDGHSVDTERAWTIEGSAGCVRRVPGVLLLLGGTLVLCWSTPRRSPSLMSLRWSPTCGHRPTMTCRPRSMARRWTRRTR